MDDVCLVCGKPHADRAHYPKRRSQGGGWGILEWIPLCREHHRLLDEYVLPWPGIIAPLADEYHARLLRMCYNDEDKIYLGPRERVAEVRRLIDGGQDDGEEDTESGVKGSD